MLERLRRQRNILTGVIVYMTLVCFIASCRNNEPKPEESKGKVIAQVYDHFLYESDLSAVLPADITSEDSARRAESYITSWVKEMLLLSKAEKNIQSGSAEIEKKLRDYRNSLIIYEYERELVRQKLDTVVADAEIEQYYNDHKGDFQLRDNIVKVIYVKVNKKAPNLTKLRNWCKSEKPQDREELDKYCRQFADNYFLDDNSWLYFDDILKEVPIETYNRELFLQNNRFVEVADSSSIYFLNIKGFMTRNSVSPLGFEKDNIRNIILNQRKLALISKMHEDLYKEGMENNSIKINTKK